MFKIAFEYTTSTSLVEDSEMSYCSYTAADSDAFKNGFLRFSRGYLRSQG